MATNTVTSPSLVSTNVVMEDLPVVSTRPSHSLCGQGVPTARIKIVFCAGQFACQSIFGQRRSYEINFWSVTLSTTSFLADVRGCWHRLRVQWLSRDACCEGVWQKDIQFVMVDSWDTFTTWNTNKEGGLMTIAFLTHEYEIRVFHWW